MEKRISYDQFQSIKRVAQACNPLMVKRDKIKEKIDALAKEYHDYDVQIASLEAGIQTVVGFRVEQLVQKVMEPGIDINGQPKKTTRYLPTDIVSYDASKRQYVIAVPEEPLASAEDKAAVPAGEKESAEDKAETEAGMEVFPKDSTEPSVAFSESTEAPVENIEGSFFYTE